MLMNSTLDRIKCGVYFDENLKPYKKDFLEMVLNFFQEKERYEECTVIRDVIKNRFDHECISSFRDF
jgi:hypothetical protein